MTDTTSLEDALGTLEDDYIDAFITEQSLSAFDAFNESLRYATRTLISGADRQTGKTLAHYHRRKLEQALHEYGRVTSDLYDIDVFIRLALEHGVVDELEHDDDYANAVACFCMSRVAIANRKVHKIPSRELEQLLGTWIGKPVTYQTLASLESIVAYLYGPSVWAIYAQDVPSNKNMAEHLWTLKLPLDKRKNSLKSIAAIADAELPEDITELC